MATAGIIHGNDGTKTDGSGGVDFVKEGEEKREDVGPRRFRFPGIEKQLKFAIFGQKS